MKATMGQLAIRLLGGFRVDVAGWPITAFETDKARALLAYLAVEADRPHRREALAALLWPDQARDVAQHNFRATLYRLRKALGETACLNVTSRDVQLAPSDGCWLDVAEFVALIDACRAHHSRRLEGCDTCFDGLNRAVELYRGEFLAGFSLPSNEAFSEWVVFRQEEYHRRAAGAYVALVNTCLRHGEHEQAVRLAQRLIELEPWNEEAHALRMQALALGGQREAAVRQYQQLRHVLATEFGTEPSAPSVSLYERICAGQLADGSRAPDVSLALPHAPPRAAFQFGTQCVARDRELAHLDNHLAQALTGAGRVVFVMGEAGAGKTALMGEFVRRAARLRGDLLAVGGHCNALVGVGDPYLPFSQALQMLLGDVDAGRASTTLVDGMADRLLASLSTNAQALVEAGPDLVGVLIQGPPLLARVDARCPGTEAAAWRAELGELLRRRASSEGALGLQQTDRFAQVTRVLRQVANLHPLIIVLDDLQWADQGSIGLLFHLGRDLVGSRILVLGAYRPDEVAVGRDGGRHPVEAVVNEIARVSGAEPVDLDRSAGRAFVTALLDAEPNRLGDAFRERLYRQTGGHALFTVELLRGLQEKGALQRDANGVLVEGVALAWEQLPRRVEAVIAERVGRLPRDQRALLEVASVEGDEFTAEVVAGVLGIDTPHAIRELSGPLGREQRLVVALRQELQAGPCLARYGFRHHLFQEYLYARLDVAERARLHGAVGNALEAVRGEQSGAIAAQLARHFEAAGLAGKAIGYLLLAGKAAIRLSAFAAAAVHLERGLSLLGTLPESAERWRLELDVQIALTVPLEALHGWGSPQLATAVARAHVLSQEVGEPAKLGQVLGLLARSAIGQARHTEAMAFAEQLLAELGGDSALAAIAHLMLGSARLMRGEPVPARQHLEQASALRDSLWDQSLGAAIGPEPWITSRMWLALILWVLGYPDQSLARCEEGIALASKTGDAQAMASALAAASLCYVLRRDHDRALDMIDAFERAFAEHDALQLRPWRTVLHGWVRATERQPSQGVALMRRGIAEWRDSGTLATVPAQYFILIETCVGTGQTDAGLQAVREARALAERYDMRLFEPEIRRLEGELLLQLGPATGVGGADVCFVDALDGARRQAARMWELRAAMSLGRFWEAQGNRERALSLLSGTLGWFTEGFDAPDLREAQLLRLTLSDLERVPDTIV